MVINNRYHPGASRRGQAGSILLEALIAFVILAGGLLVLFRFHNTTMDSTASSKIRAEAMALAEAKLEQVRGYVGTVDYNTLMQNGNGLDTYAGVDYAATFTRSWSINTNPYAGIVGEPAQINVTVTWPDRKGVTQTVTVRSGVLGGDPATGAIALAGAVAGDGDPLGGFEPLDPTTKGTGYGTGKVTVTLKDGSGTVLDPSDPLFDPNAVVTYDISFTGYIDATNALLASVTLTGDAGTTGVESCSAATGNPLAPAVLFIADGVTAYGVSTTIHPIGTLLDEFGEPLPVGTDPYRYTCSITGIAHNEAWTGTIVYEGVGNDEVCVPNTGTAELAFNEQSPAILDLGIVILTNAGACRVL